MTTYNTGNPIGSTAVKDLYDNAENLDVAVNSQDLGTWVDRLGNPRRTWHGMEQDSQDAVSHIGFESTYLTYGAGVVMVRSTQLVVRDGVYYRVADPSLLPLTLTGTWATDQPKLIDVGDASVRAEINRDFRSIRYFGAVEGVDCSVAVQAAVDWAAANQKAIFIPAGNWQFGGIQVNGAVKIFGPDVATAGANIYVLGNAPCFTFVGSSTIQGLSFVGKGSAANTFECAIFARGNDVTVRFCTFDQLFDFIVLGDAFYFDISHCRFLSNVNSWIRTGGTAAHGCDFNLYDVQATPSSGKYGFYFQNLGSFIISGFKASPGNLTENAMYFDTMAPLAGMFLMSDSVLECSAKSAIYLKGTPAKPIQFLYLSNCNISNGSSAWECITSIDHYGLYLDNCYLTTTGRAMGLNGTHKATYLTNCEFQVAGAGALIFATSTCTVIDGFGVTNPSYKSVAQFIDFLNVPDAGLTSLSVNGGQIGSANIPIAVRRNHVPRGVDVNVKQTKIFKGEGRYVANGGASLYTIPHGLMNAPARFGVLSGSMDVGNAEIREITVDPTNILVQLKTTTAAGTGTTIFNWWADV